MKLLGFTKKLNLNCTSLSFKALNEMENLKKMLLYFGPGKLRAQEQLKKLYTTLDSLPKFKKLTIEKEIIDTHEEDFFYSDYKKNSKGNFKLELMVSLLRISQDNTSLKSPQALIPKIERLNASHLRIMAISQDTKISHAKEPLQKPLFTNINLYKQVLTALSSYPNKVTLDLEYYPLKCHDQEIFTKIIELLQNKNVHVNNFKLILILDEVFEREFTNFQKLLTFSNRIKTFEIVFKCSGEIFPTYEKGWVTKQFTDALRSTNSRPKAFNLKIIIKTINELDYLMKICSEISAKTCTKELSISIISQISSSEVSKLQKIVEDNYIENKCESFKLNFSHRDGEILFKEDFDFYQKAKELFNLILVRSNMLRKLSCVANISPFFLTSSPYFASLVESFKEESQVLFESISKKFPRTETYFEFRSKITSLF